MEDIYSSLMLLPGVGIRATPGVPGGLSIAKHLVVCFGLMLSAGTGDAATMYQVTSVAEGVELVGEGSQLAGMIRAAKRENPLVDFRVIGVLEDGAGTAATGTITIAGTATAAGTLNAYIAGRRVAVGVAKGDAFGDVASALNDKIAAILELPVTSSVNAGEVAIACRHKGEIGNAIDLRVNYYAPAEKTPAGLTVTIVGMSGGVTDPSFATAIAAVPDDLPVDTWILPTTSTAALGLFTDELAERAGPEVGLPGQAFAAVRGNYSATQAVGAAQNSESLTIYGAGLTPAPPWEIAAAGAAIDAGIRHVNDSREGEVISELLPATKAFSKPERNLLLQDGISTVTIEAGRIVLERVITTRNTTLGVTDYTQLDVGIRRAVNLFRYDMAAYLRLRFRKHSLVGDDDVELVDPGVKVASPKIIESAMSGRYRQHIGAAYMRDAEKFDELIVVALSATPGRVDVSVGVTVVNALQHIAVAMVFTL
jgi:phage tail sheath gpL-like